MSATLISSLALSEAWAQIPAAPGDEGVAPPDEEPDEAFEPALPPSPVPAPETSMGPGHTPGLLQPRVETAEAGDQTRRTPSRPGPKRDDLPVVRVLDILSR